MIHPLADVSSNDIGENTNIWQYSVILPLAKIGDNCNINCHTFIENDVILGDNVTVKSGVYLWDGTRIEDDVFIGPNATFVNDKYVRSKKYPEKHIGCYIEKGASVGANATILDGIKIGKYAFIGAGAVVTKSVDPYCLVVGNPAKKVGYISKSGIRLNLKLINEATDEQYAWDTNNNIIKGR